MNKVLVSPDFLKVLFFLLVGLGYAISSLAWPRRRASFACFGDTLLEISSFALKNGARYAGYFGDCSAQSRTFEGSTWSKSIVSQTSHWSYSGSGLVAFHNCWGIQFSDGIIIIIFSINVKELLPSVVRDGWMIDSNIRYVTQGGALNRLRFCT